MAKITPKKPTKSKPSVSISLKKPVVSSKSGGAKGGKKIEVARTPVRAAPVARSRTVAAPATAVSAKTKPAAKAPAKEVAKPAAKPATKEHKEKDRAGDRMPVRMPIAPPVASFATDKPAKNQAGLKSKDLEFFKELLLAKRRELVGDVHSMEQEALRSATGSNLSNLPIHMADMGTDNYEQEFTLGLVEKDRQLLREINVALDKIRNGTYGICEGTGQPISRARLEAQPWARFSIEYARQLEKGLIRRIG